MRRSLFSNTKTKYTKILTNISAISVAVLIGTIVLPGTVFAAEQTVEVTITNQTSSAVNDYQVRVNFDTATQIQQGNMRQDCRDLYIKDSNQTSNLSYYFDPSTCNSSSTPVWVKIPTLPASPTSKTIYIKHGDGTEHNTHRLASQVFEFYDEFSNDTIGTKWAINTGSLPFKTAQTALAWVDTANSRAVIKSGSYHAFTTMSDGNTPTVFNRTATYGYSAEAKVSADNFNDYAASIVYYNPNSSVNYNKYSYHSWTTTSGAPAEAGQRIRYGTTGLADYSPQKTYTASANTWYISKLQIGNTTEKKVRASLYDSADATELSYTNLFDVNSGADFSYNGKAFGLDRWYSGTTYFDWFRVRKLLSAEPTVTLSSGGGGTPNTCNQAFGEGTVAQAFCSFVVGRFNEIVGDPNNWIETDPVFVIGNGLNDSNRRNAVTVLKNGNVGIGDSTPTEKLELNGNLKLEGNIISDGDICIGNCN